ncbi:uncharacterized protein LOC133710134 [Rosa rugosa]|uniref:uncharacterized protein LOC133710134 n=1 Tax=Rosa rugosa TaxID=74645 RepID=UPI002B40A3D0|nr:uncharacterized protein LOC133710134 [Rosa rugosa]XP_061992116.1 uncharacterized protein LOC133710134 [Rosa rugosa]XP_061992118.1 uncharacterized protein LOC133710134 [Rosa rugosa]XP_061992119.1 uncharacterized protein LOC133710134 [Rosa rugosa]XP_061992120.1 uncharacterized protein LOC133710134 [Rosa rugosa]XP_061992121.1 uncharacterized protein LOC133710134 [Rosa rugosa]XP_061992122.1 uncharacterized protein LOC133710134 [Rosa rugosa]XP_061992123.1 uncharacterized protein LOC133710134 [
MMKKYHKMYSALATYGLTEEESAMMKMLETDLSSESYLITEDSSLGLKISYQAMMENCKLEANTDNLPISDADLAYLRTYHKQHPAAEIYGFTSAESKLLDNLSKYLLARTIEWQAETEKASTKLTTGAIEELKKEQASLNQYLKNEEMVEGAATNNGRQDDFGDECDEEVDYGEEEEQGDYDNETGIDYDIGDDTAFDIENLSPFYKDEAFGKGEGNTMDINMVYVLPSKLKAQPGQSNELIGDFVADQQPRFEIDEVDAQLKDEEGRVVLTKPTAKMAQHLNPLYITAYIEGYPITKVLVDNGAAVNVLPIAVMKKLRRTESDLLPSDITVSNFSGGKSRPRGILPLDVTVREKTNMTAFFVVDSSAHYNALLGCDWIHQNLCVPSSLHQVLIFWHGDKIEVIPADNNPFQASTNVLEARFYEDDIGYFTFSGRDSKGRPTQVTTQKIVNLGTEDVL